MAGRQRVSGDPCESCDKAHALQRDILAVIRGGDPRPEGKFGHKETAAVAALVRRIAELEAVVDHLREFRTKIEQAKAFYEQPHSVDERHGDKGFCCCLDIASVLSELLG